MSFFRNKQFLVVLLSHLMVDVYVSQRAVLLAFIALALGLSNTWLGIVTTAAMLVAGLGQPFFGWLSDRIDYRWLVVGGLVWLVVGFSLAAVVPLAAAPFFIIFANLGSGAYHPAGNMQATIIGREDPLHRESLAASLFFSFGQIAAFIGPIVGGAFLDTIGRIGLLFLSIPAAILSVYNLVVFRGGSKKTVTRRTDEVLPVEGKAEPAVGSMAIVALFFFMAFQTWSQTNITTFIPKALGDMGQPAAIYGLMTALFTGGSALGNVLGGSLADRIGRKKLLLSSMVLSVVPISLIAAVPYSWLWYILIPICGLTTGAGFGVMVSMTQRQLPLKMGVASGLVLGFVFVAGASGAYISGRVADAAGFTAVFYLSAFIALLAFITGFAIKDR
ncbi:MAG TPA: MFS transporter [Longilinea sp.]|nr:MFS transporter [Longilinea sp.]